MRQTTLGMIIVWEKILLCMKKRWFWVWFWNGAWGKCEKDESIQACMIRELEEETWLQSTIDDLENMGVLHFYFDQNHHWNQDVHIFKIHKFSGELQETEEMKPEWFDIENIPYQQMWEDDRIWIPRMLDGEKVEYDFHFGNDGKIKEYKLIK